MRLKLFQTVYEDEESTFECSTKFKGCDSMCYNEYSKISHLRFWSFQVRTFLIFNKYQ